MHVQATKSVPKTASLWPAQDLEVVDCCPYCGATECALAFSAVEDWTYGCATGRWDYWRCTDCLSLYLNPRPSLASIGRAYTSYYTHQSYGSETALAWAKTILRNTCYLAWHDIALQPRLPLPPQLFPMLAPLKRSASDPNFILQELNRLPRGLVFDVGCGNGQNLKAARQLGWNVLGLEIDVRAAKTAREAGITVEIGDFQLIAKHFQRFDCVICSHVVEHVHEPLELLKLIARAIKPSGTVLISLPNATSAVLETVSVNWRGLEAPRHLSIPAYKNFVKLLPNLGFEVLRTYVTKAITLEDSLVIAQMRSVSKEDIDSMRQACLKVDINENNSDFINLVLRKIQPESVTSISRPPHALAQPLPISRIR